MRLIDVERDVGMKNLSPKEAITILEGMRIDIPVPKAAVTQWKRNAALDMAIEALKYSEFPNSSDTISRQAAIDVLGEAPKVWTDSPEEFAALSQWEMDVTAIKALPSAEPKGDYCPMASRVCFANGKEVAWCLTCPHISEEDRELVKKAVEGSQPKTGRWIEMVDADPMTGEPYICGVYCSECGERLGCESNFCPNCGADMRGEQDG